MKSLKISPQLQKINLLIVIDLALIAASLWLINFTDIDTEIQKYLFDFENKTWLFNKNEPVKKFIFYIFPKIALGVAIVFCLVASYLSSVEKKRIFLLIFLGLSLIPLIAGNIKKFTNIYCPDQLEIYNGDKPYVRIFESYPADFQQTKKGQCFPAGHPTTGFSLFILFFALPTKRQQIFGLTSAVTLGWITGFYQMAKGAHFFGDTLVTMLVCFLIAAITARAFNLKLAKRSH